MLFCFLFGNCRVIYSYEYNLYNDTKALGNMPPKYINTIVYNTKTSIQIPVHEYKNVNNITASKNPLILSFAVNYGMYNLIMFVTSMRRYYNGDALFFVSETNDPKFYYFLSRFRIDYVNITDIKPYYSLNNSKYPIDPSNFDYPKRESIFNQWAVNRIFITKEWLKYYGSKYSHFLLCDSRDVVFQGDPFNWNIRNGLYFTENTRGYRIKDSAWNVNHILFFKYGYKYIDNIVLCSGVIYSNYEGIMWWYNKVSLFMKGNIIVSDQNNLNYIFYHLNQSEIDDNHIFILCNEYGPARNLASDVFVDEERSKPKEDNLLHNLDGSIPFVIHQFDRKGKLYVNYVKKHCSDYLYYKEGFYGINEDGMNRILENV